MLYLVFTDVWVPDQCINTQDKARLFYQQKGIKLELETSKKQMRLHCMHLL